MSVPEEITQKTPAWSDEDLTSNPHQAGDKPERVEQMFTAIARRYDLNNRLHSLWQDQAWRSKAVQLAALKTSDDVVDVACGTGDLAMSFCRAGAQNVIGIDFTQAMLDVAIKKASIARLQIDYRQGDAMALDLPDCSADVLSIAFGIRNVLDPNRAFTEFMRVLKPNGRLIVLEFSTPPNRILRCLNSFYTTKIMPVTATWIARDKSGAYKYLPKSVEDFLDVGELAKSIQEAGFSSIEQVSQTFGVCTITKAVKH